MGKVGFATGQVDKPPDPEPDEEIVPENWRDEDLRWLLEQPHPAPPEPA